MSRYELQPPGEWAKDTAKQAVKSVAVIAEEVAVLALCVVSPVVYLCALVYFAIEKRVRK